MAYAGTCYFAGRPIIGIVNYNLYYLDTTNQYYEETIDTTIHEIMHVLVFNSNYYSLYLDENGNLINQNDVIGFTIIFNALSFYRASQ